MINRHPFNQMNHFVYKYTIILIGKQALGLIKKFEACYNLIRGHFGNVTPKRMSKSLQI